MVPGVALEHRGRALDDELPAVAPDQAGHGRERPQPALAEHPVGGLGHRAEDARHVAARVDDRAVGVREVALLREAVAVQDQQLVVRPRRAAPRHHLVEHRPDDVPDLRPHLVPRRPEGAWVLAAEHRSVGVVVDHPQLRPPPQQDGEARGEADARGGAQCRAPALGWTEGVVDRRGQGGEQLTERGRFGQRSIARWRVLTNGPRGRLEDGARRRLVEGHGKTPVPVLPGPAAGSTSPDDGTVAHGLGAGQHPSDLHRPYSESSLRIRPAGAPHGDTGPGRPPGVECRPAG